MDGISGIGGGPYWGNVASSDDVGGSSSTDAVSSDVGGDVATSDGSGDFSFEPDATSLSPSGMKSSMNLSELDASFPAFDGGEALDFETFPAFDEAGAVSEQTNSEEASAGPEQTYQVGKGDTLARIARQVYGDSNRWPEIYAANRDVIGDQPNALKRGTELRIPSEGVELTAQERKALHNSAHIEPPQAPAPEAPAAGEPVAGAPQTAASSNEATMRASRKGDASAALQNAQNIVDATQDRFREDFIQQYKNENGGRAPSEAAVKEAYNQEFLKAFVLARYPSFVQQEGIQDRIGGNGIPFAGFNPDNVNPVFKSEAVKEMMESFPNTYRSSPGAEPVSVNHLLSGIQFQATDADSVPNWITKQTIGTAVNSHVAETVLKDRRSQEKSFGGMDAAYSPELQKAFIEQGPVQGLKSFFDDPSKHIDAGRNNYAVNPLSLIQRGYGYIINQLRD